MCDVVINEKNILNWFKLFIDIEFFKDEDTEKLRKYVTRTDIVRRRKEIEDIFGGEEW